MEMTSSAAYGSLDEYVLRHGGLLVSSCGRQRRSRMIRMIIEEWPVAAPPAKIGSILSARVEARIKQEYGSVVLIILAQMLASVLVKLIIEWWFSDFQNRGLMESLHAEARRDL